MSKQIEAMRNLGFSEEEIQQILADDKRIDRGEKLFELSAEQEKVSKQARQADRKPTVYKLDNTEGKRSKKANGDKQAIISRLTATVEKFVSNSQCANIEIINPEREFTFTYNGTKYKIVLSAPRS